MKNLVNKLKENGLAVVILIGACVMLFALGVSFVNEQEEQELLAETPLAETSYWYSLDNFPKYKLEAAEIVQEQMEAGVSKEEACQIAIDQTSDKIYQDYLDFANANPDLGADEWSAELEKYLASRQ